MAQTADTAPSSGPGMVGSVEFEASASARDVAVQWRPLGQDALEDGPEFRLEGIKARSSFAPYEGPASLVFAIGGSEAEIARQLGLAAEVGAPAVESGTRMILARLSPEFEVLAEPDSPDALVAALNALAPALTPSADIDRTLPRAFEFAVENPGRTGLVYGAPGMPVEEDVRFGIASAAVNREVYLFPIRFGAEDEAIAPFAEVTGGKLLGEGESDVLAGLLGGGTRTLRLPVHLTYRLPGEAERSLTLVVQSGGDSQEIELAHSTPILSTLETALRTVQPHHWSGWFSQPGRRLLAGLGAGSNLLLIGGLFLVVRRMLASGEGSGKVVRPADELDVVLAPLKKTIGRKPGCDYRLSDASVSRLHAHLYQDGGRIWIVDENSTNGTFILEGEQWVQTETTSVEVGDKLRFGDCVVTVEELLAEVALVPPQPGDTEPDDAALQRFRKPRRNPYTGKIEEGAV